MNRIDAASRRAADTTGITDTFDATPTSNATPTSDAKPTSNAKPTSANAPIQRQTSAVQSLDALVIGAGVGGLYQLHLLRARGLNARACDAAGDVGGTWWWNCYPGARFDSESHVYQYLFSEELFKGWSWSERFPGQPEIERWLRYVADRLDLRRHIHFNTVVTKAVFDDARARWRVETADGARFDVQFLICCVGALSAPLENAIAGADSFRGAVFHTSRWPRQPMDLSDQRVGVIGVGATGIQVIQTLAGAVRRLTAFVRTPQYVLPMRNPRYGSTEIAAYKARFAELKEVLPRTFTGFEHDFEDEWRVLTPAQRRAALEKHYNDGSLKLWLASFAELFSDPDVNAEVSEFVRDKMRARLRDPALCKILIPQDYGFGVRRVPLEMNYLEAYHRPDVAAVGVRDNPIERIVETGVRLADGTVHELDTIVLATGFDAASGSLTRIDIRGRGGRSLRQEWSRDIRTTLGLQIHGYPNLFTTAAPLAPSAALCNMTTCLQQQAEWIAQCIGHLRSVGLQEIEPTAELEAEWIAHHEELARESLLSQSESWYVGANVPGKPRRLLAYVGGARRYHDHCAAIAADGYPGFTLR